jgi:hypothetical protein
MTTPPRMISISPTIHAGMSGPRSKSSATAHNVKVMPVVASGTPALCFTDFTAPCSIALGHRQDAGVGPQAIPRIDPVRMSDL